MSLRDLIFRWTTCRACIEFLKASDGLKPRIRANKFDHPNDSGLKMEYPGGKKSTFSTCAFLRFSSRLKSSRSISEHMLCVWKSGYRGASSTKWFEKIKNGNLYLEGTLRSARPSELDEDHPKAPLKEDGR
ncbi:hypothetical protein LAZ67_4003443 [Cordylochernes scorpioides]|uniref:Uncharacterized protein n=1 Tax=Cordylochernes scorpioides TaxID=51811 RepID=A0ABY6KET0_9ARAC|nr:hypothetical protein LAZ67_4003443 [Cordylochernes scorpioides]